MDDVLQYQGKHTVVTGAASGIGAATAEILVGLGARVTGLDIRESPVAGVESVLIDLKDRASIDAVVAGIDGPVDAIFSIAGLPGEPFSDIDTVTVNVIGARHLIESLLPKLSAGAGIVCVGSNAGLGWETDVEKFLPLITSAGFDEAVAYLTEHPEVIDHGYVFSKKAINIWVAWRATQLIKDGIRLNCSNPGPTQTAMMPTFEDQSGKEVIDIFAGPSGRRSSAEEQAWPLVFVNSPRSSYVAGEAMHIDAAFLASMVVPQE
jgi:NAD(P)-dependent dehydrogenase (short-subunit alcohol dehydrogenase family)